MNGKVCWFASGCGTASAGKSMEGTNEERNLGWAKGTLLDNFQLDGKGSIDFIKAYTSDWTMWYW